MANHYRTVWRISGELVLRMPWGSSVGSGTLGFYERSMHWGVETGMSGDAEVHKDIQEAFLPRSALHWAKAPEQS